MEFLSALETIRTTADLLGESVNGFCSRLQDGREEVSMKDGLGLLDVKVQTFLSYVAQVTMLAAMKVEGDSIVDHPIVDALVESRVVLEKIKPLEEALKYQIDRLSSTAGADDEEKTFAPNLSALMDDDEEEGDGNGVDEDGENEREAGDKKYRPPRLAAVRFNDSMERDAERERKREERELDRARRSRGLRELYNEVTERPEEIQGDTQIGGRAEEKLRIMEQDRVRFEEDFFVRTEISKVEKRKRRNLQRKANYESMGGGSDMRELLSISDKITKRHRQTQKDLHSREIAAEQFGASTQKKRQKMKKRK